MSFVNSLSIGKQAEKDYAEKVLGIASQVDEDSKNKYWDILHPITLQRFEVKCDGKSKFTGNFYIETGRGAHRPDEKSGLAITQAEYWVITAGDGVFYTFVTKQLKEALKSLYKQGLVRKIKIAGDGNSGGLVVATAELVAFACKVDSSINNNNLN